MKKIKVSIVGGSGYTGVELLRILVNHPNITLDQITSRTEHGINVEDHYPFFRGKLKHKFIDPEKADFSKSDLVFFATPNGIAMNHANFLLKNKIKIIDLAADFRIKDVPLWEKWYDMKHSAPQILPQAVYGLTELNHHNIKVATLVANPGCYPTASQLALYPLLKNDLIFEDDIIIDAKSGISGAGKRNDPSLLMSESSENFKAYAISGHRHEPEIISNLKELTEKSNINVTFVPHLVPMVRGIFVSVYTKLKQETSEQDIANVFEQSYKDSLFVDFMGQLKMPETKTVRGSNYCRISFVKKENRLIIFSVIDNLVKGAAGQAIQNMNLMFNFEENIGLEQSPVYP